MKVFILSLSITCAIIGQAFAWGQEGHSIIAELAQQRLNDAAATAVKQLLNGRSLASVASWADDIRDVRPDTYNWHFVDIPIHSSEYNEARDCKDTPKGDCLVHELRRLRTDVRCASGRQQVEALKFAVHFVGDIHQPLHTVLEASGGNDIPITLLMRGRKFCAGDCKLLPQQSNFHAAWDTGLIQATVWDWGAYVDLIENGWLISPEAHEQGIDGGMPRDWAAETHKAAQKVWQLLPSGQPLDDEYYTKVAPILDRQLGVAGLRLARFLNDAFASNVCPVP
jgi:hypothetical protein